MLWIQQLSPDRLPTGHLCTGLAGTMKGIPWSFTCIACISPKRAKEGPPSPEPRGWGASGWQADPGCAVPKPGLLQSTRCHLQTVLPLLLVCSGSRGTPAITEPTQDCPWKTSQDGKPSLPGLFFLDSRHPGLLWSPLSHNGGTCS